MIFDDVCVGVMCDDDDDGVVCDDDDDDVEGDDVRRDAMALDDVLRNGVVCGVLLCDVACAVELGDGVSDV